MTGVSRLQSSQVNHEKEKKNISNLFSAHLELFSHEVHHMAKLLLYDKKNLILVTLI